MNATAKQINVTFTIEVGDLIEAQKFYCENLPFQLIGNTVLKNDLYFVVTCFNENIKLRLQKKHSKNQGTKESSVIFGKVDIQWLFMEIKNMPEKEIELGNPDLGCSTGINECPGGLFTNIRDPFGNILSFSEW
ncbi:hypothetical protein ACFX58_19560 [Sphingomonas sp. NCPPB 2930]